MNRPLVSIIVPTKNSASTLKACLKSINSQSYSNRELIVVDNNSIDETKSIANTYTQLVYDKGPERSAQRNYGARKAKGEYLLFIDSDMVLSRDVVSECVQAVNINKTLVGLIIPEESVGEGFWAKCKTLERSFYLGVEWMEGARFFSKNAFWQFKGYDETQTGTEDFDLPQRIKSKMGKEKIGRIDSVIYHMEGKLSLIYTLQKKYYYTKTARKYLLNSVNKMYFNKQSSIIERYMLFFSNPRKLCSNPIIGIGMLFMKTTEFVAGGLGYLQSLLLTNKI